MIVPVVVRIPVVIARARACLFYGIVSSVSRVPTFGGPGSSSRLLLFVRTLGAALRLLPYGGESMTPLAIISLLLRLFLPSNFGRSLPFTSLEVSLLGCLWITSLEISPLGCMAAFWITSSQCWWTLSSWIVFLVGLPPLDCEWTLSSWIVSLVPRWVTLCWKTWGCVTFSRVSRCWMTLRWITRCWMAFGWITWCCMALRWITWCCMPFSGGAVSLRLPAPWRRMVSPWRFSSVSVSFMVSPYIW